MPGRSTSGFHRPGRHLLAPSAKPRVVSSSSRKNGVGAACSLTIIKNRLVRRILATFFVLFFTEVLSSGRTIPFSFWVRKKTPVCACVSIGFLVLYAYADAALGPGRPSGFWVCAIICHSRRGLGRVLGKIEARRLNSGVSMWPRNISGYSA